MKFVKYAQRAYTDLEDITDYTARNWGAQQAKKYIRDIRLKIDAIAQGEVVGQPVRVTRREVWKTRVNRHLIIFAQTDDTLFIVRVLHEAMDIPHQMTK